MDDNWFMTTDSDAGGMNIDTSGFDLGMDFSPGEIEQAATGAQFFWGDGDAGPIESMFGGDAYGGALNLTADEQKQLADYITANPDALDAAYGTGATATLSKMLSGAGGAASKVGSFLSGVPTNAWGAGALLASGLISGKEAKELLHQQTESQKELLQYKHDLDKPTAWVVPQRGLLRLR